MLSASPNHLATGIRSFAHRAGALELRLRTTRTEPMGEPQRRFARVRRKLTELHVLLPWARGRLHVVRPPRERSTLAEWSGRDHHEEAYAGLAPWYCRPQPEHGSAPQ